MILPDNLVVAALRASKANAAFLTEPGGRHHLRKRTFRPQRFGPPRQLRPDVVISAGTNAAGWPVYTVAPRTAPARGNVVYAHGGGWVNEVALQHWQLAAQIAAEVGTPVQMAIYPLIPFGTAQAVVDGVTDMLVESLHTHGPTVLAGDSAGGQIALSAILQLRDRHGLKLPRTIAISPALDLSMKNPDIPVVQPSDPWLGTKGTQIFIDLWKGALDVNDPIVSPLNGELEGLGPITLFTGTRDILNPDSRLYAEKATKAGVDLEFLELEGQIHVYPLLPTVIGRDARATIVERVREAISG